MNYQETEHWNLRSRMKTNFLEVVAKQKYLVAAATYLLLTVLVSSIIPHFVLCVVDLMLAKLKHLVVAAVQRNFFLAVDSQSISSQLLNDFVVAVQRNFLLAVDSQLMSSKLLKDIVVAV